MTGHNRVVIETGTKKVFASAIDWPGWSRSGKTEDEALEALRQYAERYQRVAGIAGVEEVAAAAESFAIIERLKGSAVTDFGVPAEAAELERAAEPMPDAECERQIRLLRACWQAFDDTAARVSEELRKGPRGGGRNRTKIIEHTLEADRGYARKVGVKTAKGAVFTDDGLREHRDAVCAAIRAINTSGEVPGSWPLRYYIRRAAWHLLDHAWEMEDKDLTGQDV
ncbi:MAG: hypothetical protein IT338_07920 [Thermomicrobiales bacterium]|nr:hypothetical protein [Thermomicrobiales bacterium]